MAATEVMTSWSGAQVHHAQLAVRHTTSVSKVQISSTKKAPASSVSHTDKVTAAAAAAAAPKRSSLFTRRRSLSQTTIQTPAIRDSNASSSTDKSKNTASSKSQSSSEAVDMEHLKNKLRSSLQASKKTSPTCSSSPRKSVSGPSTSSSSKISPSKSSPNKTAQRASSSQDLSPQISKPFGFQHLANIQKSPKPEETIVNLAHASIAAFNFQASNHDQSVKQQQQQRRPPPLRPQRPAEHEIPHALLSPRIGLPTLRQAKSAEVVGSPLASPRLAAAHPESGLYTPRLAPPQRSLSLPFVDTIGADLPVDAPSKIAPTPAPTSHAALLEQVVEEAEGVVAPPSFRRGHSMRPLDASAPPQTALQVDDLEPFLPRISLLPSIVLPRPLSCGSDTLGDLSLRLFEIDTIASQQVSEVVDEFDFTSSWDDDIEFAYSHGAEAHGDFDWHRLSQYRYALACESSESVVLQEVPISRGTRHQYSSSWASTAGSEHGPLHPSRLASIKVPQRDSIPDLEDHMFTPSGSTSSLFVGTPEDNCGFMTSEPDIASSPDSDRRRRDNIGFISPQLPPLGLKHDLDTDQLFDDLMAGFAMKQKHGNMLPTLEAKTYNDPSRRRHRSISDATPLTQSRPACPIKQNDFASATTNVRASDVSVYTMQVCLDSSLAPCPDLPVPAAAPQSTVPAALPNSTKRRKSRSKTLDSEWPIVIIRNSLDAPSSTNSSPRSSSDSASRQQKLGAQPPTKTVTFKTESRRSSFSLHKKSVSADGLPLSRHAFLSRPSNAVRGALVPTQAPPAKTVPIVSASRARRMTAF